MSYLLALAQGNSGGFTLVVLLGMTIMAALLFDGKPKRGAAMRMRPLAYVVLEAVRYAFEKPAHPDSKRQRRSRMRSVQLRAARRAKAVQP